MTKQEFLDKLDGLTIEQQLEAVDALTREELLEMVGLEPFWTAEDEKEFSDWLK